MFSVIETRAKRVRFSTVGYFEKGELSRRIYAALRRNKTNTAAGVADEAMAEEQLADPRIRSLACRDSYPGSVNGKLIRLRNGYNVRWELAEADPL